MLLIPMAYLRRADFVPGGERGNIMSEAPFSRGADSAGSNTVGSSSQSATPHQSRATSGGAHDSLHSTPASLVAACVHCGFCLPACPTYQLWGEEMDSPRGRIDLMRQTLDGTVKVDKMFAAHMDACLGCMACMTACPSDVQYDQLIEATRAQIERTIPRSPGDRAYRSLIFWLFPYKERLRRAAYLGLLYKKSGLAKVMDSSGLLKALPSRLAALAELLPDVSAKELARAKKPFPDRISPKATARFRVGLQTGCVASVFFANVHEATIRVLVAEDIEVVIPQGQGCCGALSQHCGQADSLEFAQAMITLWESVKVDFIVTNAAGCGSTLKDYYKLLGNDPKWAQRAKEFSQKVRDVMELLGSIELTSQMHPIAKKVAYHDACHLAHAQKIRSEPRRVLSMIPQLELLEVPDGNTCCGSAGVYNLLQVEAATDLGKRKANNIDSLSPDLVSAGNPGCLLQIERYLASNTPLVHPIVILDASISGDLAMLSPKRRTKRALASRERKHGPTEMVSTPPLSPR